MLIVTNKIRLFSALYNAQVLFSELACSLRAVSASPLPQSSGYCKAGLLVSLPDVKAKVTGRIDSSTLFHFFSSLLCSLDPHGVERKRLASPHAQLTEQRSASCLSTFPDFFFCILSPPLSSTNHRCHVNSSPDSEIKWNILNLSVASVPLKGVIENVTYLHILLRRTCVFPPQVWDNADSNQVYSATE